MSERRPVAGSAALARPRALLFDWDSTLVDNWRSIAHAINATLVAMGHQAWTAEEIQARVRESMRDAFPRLFGERWPEARKIFYDTFAASHLEHLEALPGAEAMLAELAGNGFYLAVVSNKTGPLLRKEAAHLGWTRYFSQIVGAGDAERDKPDPAPITLALEGSSVDPGAEVWLVGDTALDMACAIGTGCVPVLIAGKGLEYDDFSAWPPSCTVSDCQALAALVRGL